MQDFLADDGAPHGVWLIGGTLPLVAEADDKVRNTTWCSTDRASAWRATTRSTCSASSGRGALRRGATIEPGSTGRLLRRPAGRTGLSICYDLRFPELFRAMGEVDC
jgi:predicted amidohydrolase